ncbi:hypothetical protein [Rhodopseudomonas palustris]|uniref:hypothetical protein n=1 Tax=Rhodopseudomonas palustris TaxID=1076 RepID=UPI0021F2EAD6|nr:hypothetical protein [Rhodopseudomonas palustris]UYO55194.1 hypothetical protein KQX61_07265 [Rhodopseudomonas palustris]
MREFETNPNAIVIGAGALIGGAAFSVGQALVNGIAASGRAVYEAELAAIRRQRLSDVRARIERLETTAERVEAWRRHAEDAAVAAMVRDDDDMRRRLLASGVLSAERRS